MKTIMMGVAAALMLGAGAVAANQSSADSDSVRPDVVAANESSTGRYSVQSDEVNNRNNAAGADGIDKVCNSRVAVRHLAGGEGGRASWVPAVGNCRNQNP